MDRSVIWLQAITLAWSKNTNRSERLIAWGRHSYELVTLLQISVHAHLRVSRTINVALHKARRWCSRSYMHLHRVQSLKRSATCASDRAHWQIGCTWISRLIISLETSHAAFLLYFAYLYYKDRASFFPCSLDVAIVGILPVIQRKSWNLRFFQFHLPFYNW